MYLVRTKKGFLYIFRDKPILHMKESGERIYYGKQMRFVDEMFPEVTYENSPVEMEVSLKLNE